MKPKTLVLTVVALTCGLGASWMACRLLAERQHDEPEKVQVLVAKRDLNLGETIKYPQGLFEFKDFSKGEEPQDAVRDFESLKGRVLKIHRRAGDCVREEDLLSRNDEFPKQERLPEGYRAMGLRIDLDHSHFDRSKLYTARFDVINTVIGADGSSTVSKLLEDVRILLTCGRGIDHRAYEVLIFALAPENTDRVLAVRDVGFLTLVLKEDRP